MLQIISWFSHDLLMFFLVDTMQKKTTKLIVRQKPNLGANIHWLRHHYAKMIRNQNSSENTGFQLQHATNADILILKY